MWIGGENMKINESVGIIFDAFFYSVAFFNKKALGQYDAPYNMSDQTRLSHYNSFRSTAHVPDPPESLFPLFYYNGHRCCAMTAYLEKYFDYFHGTIDDLYSLLHDKSKFKKFIMAYYFDSYFDDRGLQRLCLAEGETVMKAVAILSETVEIKYYTQMFFHFSDVVNAAIEYLELLIPCIQAYHHKFEAETENVFQEFTSLDNQRIINKGLLHLDDPHAIDLKNQMYSICYLNQYIIFYQSTGRQYLFAIGCDWANVISHALDGYRHVTMKSIMNSLGHPTKVDIINELRKQELTVSQLARILHLARTSISRYVVDLLDEFVIVKSHKAGPEIYYRLNPTYLRYARSAFTEYLDQAILDADKLL